MVMEKLRYGIQGKYVPATNILFNSCLIITDEVFPTCIEFLVYRNNYCIEYLIFLLGT